MKVDDYPLFCNTCIYRGASLNLVVQTTKWHLYPDHVCPRGREKNGDGQSKGEKVRERERVGERRGEKEDIKATLLPRMFCDL